MSNLQEHQVLERGSEAAAIPFHGAEMIEPPKKPAKSTGRVFLVTDVLKDLRNERMQSQEEMANACLDGRFRVSIATIKRAETGRAVVYRVARELARYFDVPVWKIVKGPKEINTN
jgi:DNA-binding XRE family transcriptional regulator